MAIKVSTLLGHNTDLVLDLTPSLGGALNTNNFPIANGSNPVTISGNQYPITTGSPGQVLTTNGAGVLSWQNAGLSPTGVIPGTYGSASTVGVFTVNATGQLTNAVNAPISITPAQAGLGNVTNQLQVINAGGAPSIRESVGAPAGTDNIGAIYIDQAVTNGDSIYRYNGTTWDVIAVRPNLYDEKVNGFTPPAAQALDSVAIGSGAETSSTANNSLAIGIQSLARIPYGFVQAGGTELVSITVTPPSTSTKYCMSFSVPASASTNNNVHTAAFFRGTTYLGAAVQTFSSGGNSATISFCITDSPATTSSITYSIRYGTSANTWYVNRRSTENTYGGLNSGWLLEEF